MTYQTTHPARRPAATVPSHPDSASNTARTTARITARTTAGSGGKPAVAFISGLVGLLVANLVLGPLAITLGILSLRDGTSRRGRAILGICLGITDIVVFAALMLHSVNGSGGLTWRFSSF